MAQAVSFHHAKNRDIDVCQWIVFDCHEVAKNNPAQLAQRANVASRDTPVSEVCMDIQDAQRESRSVFIGGFWGQLVSSIIWLVSAALGTWVSPKASILTALIAGFFIFPLTQLMLRLSGRRASLSRENPFNNLGMQVAFVLPFSMLLLVPVGLNNLNLFFRP
ncbi:MAG TPA: hypothetical protein VJO16_10000 [Candidatus Acidoferrum sp.]|nr:hypothetical protein [Candidatus Acidoferrum sp.]